MSGTSDAARGPGGNAEDRAAGAGEEAPQAADAGGNIPLDPEALAQLDAATKRVLDEDQDAEMRRLASEEVGVTTDPASGESSRRFTGE